MPTLHPLPAKAFSVVRMQPLLASGKSIRTDGLKSMRQHLCSQPTQRQQAIWLQCSPAAVITWYMPTASWVGRSDSTGAWRAADRTAGSTRPGMQCAPCRPAQVVTPLIANESVPEAFELSSNIGTSGSSNAPGKAAHVCCRACSRSRHLAPCQSLPSHLP